MKKCLEASRIKPSELRTIFVLPSLPKNIPSLSPLGKVIVIGLDFDRPDKIWEYVPDAFVIETSKGSSTNVVTVMVEN